MQLVIIFAIAIAIGAVVFATQNAVPVTVTFLAWRFDSSLALVLLLAMACGVLVVVLWSAPAALRVRWQLARQRRQIARLEAEVAELKRQVQRPASAAAEPAGEA